MTKLQFICTKQTSFNENYTSVNRNCKYNASNKTENANTKRVSLFVPPYMSYWHLRCFRAGVLYYIKLPYLWKQPEYLHSFFSFFSIHYIDFCHMYHTPAAVQWLLRKSYANKIIKYSSSFSQFYSNGPAHVFFISFLASMNVNKNSVFSCIQDSGPRWRY